MRLARLLRDSRGATLVEFAMVLPVMLVLMMGMMELGYQAYVQSVLTGAVQKAGRDSAIQGATPATIDAKVLAQVNAVAPRATFASGYPTRLSYSSFSTIAPEPFVDTNGNGVRNAGECYTDVNGNGQWDADAGRTGQGGANDATVYTAAVTYSRLFPVTRLFGWPGTATLTASTTLMNQPYATQSTPSPPTICT
ncbi:TadE/TadG family type IV pilus assembly protein [Sphingomonas sp. KR3-1]|uniref:TadE/TadG family type IV pilus assembly protein n=1 Tax=Sphingomonas sp. KR3-1 TaxID=3156611 RepID=UPI0032B41604